MLLQPVCWECLLLHSRRNMEPSSFLEGNVQGMGAEEASRSLVWLVKEEELTEEVLDVEEKSLLMYVSVAKKFQRRAKLVVHD